MKALCPAVTTAHLVADSKTFADDQALLQQAHWDKLLALCRCIYEGIAPCMRSLEEQVIVCTIAKEAEKTIFGGADETQKLHQARELAMLTRDLLIEAEQSVVSSLQHQLLSAKEPVKRKNPQHKTIAEVRREVERQAMDFLSEDDTSTPVLTGYLTCSRICRQ